MSTYLFIPGNHPHLSAAELKYRYPDSKPEKGDGWIRLESELELNQSTFDSLGGSLKMAKVLKHANRDDLQNDLAEAIASFSTGSKLDYGISLYGWSEKNLRPVLLQLKKNLRQAGVSSRFINHDFHNVSSAQYKSIREKGVELLVTKIGQDYVIAHVVGVQNIDAYSARDFEKPFRDMSMGMLPPKLAQILINLTGVQGAVWDPFCGSGTVVMEGLLMGRNMVGTDIDPERVEGALKNAKWLREHFSFEAEPRIFVHDATQSAVFSFDAIAFEGDLGTPHNQFIRPDSLEKIMNDLHHLYLSFFSTLKQSKTKVPIVCALPFFRLKNGQDIFMNETITAVEKLGFEPSELWGGKRTLCYFREDQAVGRAISRYQLG